MRQAHIVSCSVVTRVLCCAVRVVSPRYLCTLMVAQSEPPELRLYASSCPLSLKVASWSSRQQGENGHSGVQLGVY